MYVRRLSLTNFRCYRELDLTLPGGTVVLAGGNAQGKTSLLEAIYVASTTRSPLAGSDSELIHWGAGDDVMPYSRVRAEIARAGEQRTIEILNVRQPDGGGPQYTKRCLVDHAARRAMDVVGLLNVVLFAPRDLAVVDGGPSERRRYLDVLLCQTDRAYCRALSRYGRLITQRNHLLRRLRDRGGDREELTYWTERLVADGARLLGRRMAAATALDELAGAIHAELTGGTPLAVIYRATAIGEQASGAAPPDEADLAASFAQALEARHGEELARGMTVVGPHRDDLGFLAAGVDMRTFGSRGQQRTVALALKLAEARLMWSSTGERPVLLLDDVLSELDVDRQRQLLAHVDAHQQTIVTTTHAEHLPAGFRDEALVLEVEEGAITAARRDGRAITPPVG